MMEMKNVARVRPDVAGFESHSHPRDGKQASAEDRCLWIASAHYLGLLMVSRDVIEKQPKPTGEEDDQSEREWVVHSTGIERRLFAWRKGLQAALGPSEGSKTPSRYVLFRSSGARHRTERLIASSTSWTWPTTMHASSSTSLH